MGGGEKKKRGRESASGNDHQCHALTKRKLFISRSNIFARTTSNRRPELSINMDRVQVDFIQSK